MVFIVKMSKEDLQKIRDDVYGGLINDTWIDEFVIKKALFREHMNTDIEVLKIVD